ncbi:MAG: hypothetical protein IAF38_09455 [Bacteroidia bacterium]|nr:hypothetical protein [Bacteroidia bacterium]
MLRKSISIILLSLFLLSFSGESKWKRMFTIKYAADFFTTDNIGNIYVIQNDEMVKYNANGDLLKKYSNKKLGKIFSVDASNALRVLVYYKDFSVLVILDSQLTQNGENITLEIMQLEQSDLACNSFQNGIWLYNRQNAELVRLDENLTKVVNTGNLNRILSTELHPNVLIEYNGYVYLNDPANGILVFDIYGTFYKTISIKGLSAMQFNELEIYYFQNKRMEDYHTKELWTVDLPLPDTSVISARVEKGLYYMQFKDSVSVYSYSPQ